jgi:hypothetical protein
MRRYVMHTAEYKADAVKFEAHAVGRRASALAER